MIEAYKFRLYPTEEQEVLLSKHFGSVRFVYNWALDYSKRQYAETRRHLGWMTIASSDDYKKLKADNQWLYEVGATTLQNTIGHLDKAFKRFFRKKGGFPRYKSKYDYSQSFEIPAGLKLDFRHGKIQIPKFIVPKLFVKVKYGCKQVKRFSSESASTYFTCKYVHEDNRVQ